MDPYGQSDPPFQPPPTYGQPYAPYGGGDAHGPPMYGAYGDAKTAPPEKDGGEGYDVGEGRGDLGARHHEDLSEVTLRGADDDRDTGREREARV
jgi:hypothetical protein